jgi:hypothetical protein
MTSMDEQSKCEMDYLYDLERHHNLIQPFAQLNSEYLRMRPDLLKIIVGVASHHKICDDAVYLAASLLDAYSSRSIVAQGDPDNALSVAKLPTFALAAFVTAGSYTGGAAVYYKYSAMHCRIQEFPCRTENIPLSHYVNSWNQQSMCVMSAQEANEVALSSRDLKKAQIDLAAAIDWRLNRATANRFLDVFVMRTFDARNKHLQAGYSCDELMAAIKFFIPWARYFCETAVMSNISCYHTQSSIAAASILAAHNHLQPGEHHHANLLDLYGVIDQQEILACVDTILELHQHRDAAKVLHDSADAHCETVEQDGHQDLYCTEDMLDVIMHPAVLTPSSLSFVVESTPATAKRIVLASDENDNFMWDTPPIWHSPSTRISPSTL